MSILWKSLVYDYRVVENAIFWCLLFHFSKFQVTIVKNLMKKKQTFLQWILKVLMKLTNNFDKQDFSQWNDGFYKIFEISMEMYFVSLFLHYANTINKPYLQAVFAAILFFFQFLVYVYFSEPFVKNFMKKLAFFNKNFQNSFQDVEYYRILECQNLWH